MYQQLYNFILEQLSSTNTVSTEAFASLLSVFFFGLLISVPFVCLASFFRKVF